MPRVMLMEKSMLKLPCSLVVQSRRDREEWLGLQSPNVSQKHMPKEQHAHILGSNSKDGPHTEENARLEHGASVAALACEQASHECGQ
ncbi:hypothetical protein GOP47_0019004 [Adiantum capillus-veneris]|uniref:Uncharacterized protein n=1 Tax=Adiantum capillus-veneris TaxID=13818 RepID=A0A9D4UEG0_ADICA|nr:hypothetical protein GOP47_0019004 [Adiantum capillus-veneris]